MRLLALLLTVTLTGPTVTSLLCDWACAAKHQVAATAPSGCHEHGSEASTPTLARGHQCHDISASPDSVLTSGPQLFGVVAIGDTSLIVGPSAQPRDPSRDVFHDPPSAPPPLLLALRI